MEELSKRHHYLPQFYIKKFCDADGSIYINDKNNKKNYDNVSKKFPRAIFFELERNTYVINEKQTDVVEKLYGYLEDKIAPHLELLKDNCENGIDTMTVEMLRYLIFFGYLTKWRIPKNDEKALEINQQVSFEELNIGAKINDFTIALEDLTTEEISRELKRFLLAGSIFSDTEMYKEVFKNCFILYFPYPLLVTDNPFVELPYKNVNEIPSFIFPLTSNLLLVSTSGVDKHEISKVLKNEKIGAQFIELLYRSVQITLMWYAKKFVGCQDRDYLKSFVSQVESYSNNLQKMNRNPAHIAFTVFKNYKGFADTFSKSN